MKLSIKKIKKDVLIIGGGCAGSMAAISLSQINPNVSICIMEKGHIKRSGSVTMGMDALNVVVIPGLSTPREYVEMVKSKCWGIVDEAPSYQLAERSYEILKTLESWGVFFPKDESGNYSLMAIDENGKFCVGMDEPDLKVILERKIRAAKVSVLNKTMAVELLVFDGRVVGAIGLNIIDGSLVICEAKSVILANGSAARFGLPNTGYLYGTFDFPGNAGDGFALAYRAGTRLTGMEYTLKYALVKDLNIPLIYIVITRGARAVDLKGKILVDESNLSIHRLIDELEKNDGPVFLQTDHLSKEKIKEIESILFSTERPMQRRFWELKNIKFGRDLIELNLTEAQLCGGHGISGIVINKHAETDIDGLFAAGDVSSVPMQHLTGAFVYGKKAAESAAKYITTFKMQVPEKYFDERLDGVTTKLKAFMNPKSDSISHKDYEYKLRRIINEYLLSPKSSYSLTKGLNAVLELKEQLPKYLYIKDYHELGKAFELEFILDCAQMSAVASLNRQESRWGSIHKRLDFPETDNNKWLKHIDLKRGNNDDIRVTFREVQRGK